MILKHSNLVEIVFAYREENLIRQELSWLLEETSLEKALILLKKWVPEIEAAVFKNCVRALSSKKRMIERFALGRKMRRSLQFYARYSSIRASLIVNCRFFNAVFRRLFVRKRNKIFSSGGRIIAVVGAEATGKSTLVREISDWLGKFFLTYTVHAGKPPSSSISFFPNLLLPWIRKTLSGYRTSRVESRIHSDIVSYPSDDRVGDRLPLLYMIRCLMIAFDRKKLLSRVLRRASRGAIMICDRYPTAVVGAMDSPRLIPSPSSGNYYSLKNILARKENSIYNQIPRPDVVLKLQVPLEIAINRNRERIKKDKEDEDYVRRRHDDAAKIYFKNTQVYEINTATSLNETLLLAKRIIWSHL
jgi:thymidylate kinase